MTIKIKQYKLVKQEVDSKEFILPEKIEYYFETGMRRSIRIVPIWTTWNKKTKNIPEEIYAYNITCVYRNFEAKIENFSIEISHIEDIYYGKDKHSDFVRFWIDNNFNERTEDQFKEDLINVLNKIQTYTI